MAAEKKNWTTVTVVWMGLAALAIGAFWHGWNLITGEIPVLTEIKWLAEKTGVDGAIERPATIITMPFGLSRSWDMLGAVLFVWIGFRLKRRAEVKSPKQADFIFGLVGGLVGGLVVGLGGGLGLGPVDGPGFGLISGLGYSFVVGLFWLGLLPGLAMFIIITAPLWLIISGVAVYRAFKNRPRADWSGVKALLTGSPSNDGIES